MEFCIIDKGVCSKQHKGVDNIEIIEFKPVPIFFFLEFSQTDCMPVPVFVAG